MDEPERKASVLFICSRDYGELNMARFFAAGWTSANSASYLVPEQLRVAVTGLSERVLIYTELDEIPALVEELDPDLVLLFSGYLFTGHRLFSLQPWPAELGALKRVVKRLRESGRPLATSDPFCGLTGRMKPWTFRLSSNGLLVESWHQRLVVPLRAISIWLHCRRLQRLLGALPHIYPGCVPSSPNTLLRMAFFNQAEPEEINSWFSGLRGEMSNPLPVWLFVISLVDLMIQRNTSGQDFAAVVARRLADAHQQGRKPILIAPASFLEEVRCSSSPGFDGEMHESMPYFDFMATLMNCEYAFYWNIFSSTTILRILLRRPVFFFDQGHLSRLIRGYHEDAVGCYLGGREPLILDTADVLSSEALESYHDLFRDYSQSVLDHLAKSPSPSQIVDDLIAGTSTGS